MVVYWHHCLLLDLETHKVSLPGGVSNTWLSCWAPSEEITKCSSLTGELLFSPTFWCGTGAARCQSASQSHPTPPWKIILDHRPAPQLLGKTAPLFIWRSEYNTELLLYEHWDLSCPSSASKCYPRLEECQICWLVLFCVKLPIMFLFQ